MKKKMIVTGVAAIALVAALQTSSVFAAAPAKETPSVYTAAPAKKTPSVYTTAPAEKKSSDDTNTGTVCNYCSGDCSFVDEDGDGICDNYASRGQNGTCGWGGGHGHGNHGLSGHGHGGGCHRR